MPICIEHPGTAVGDKAGKVVHCRWAKLQHVFDNSASNVERILWLLPPLREACDDEICPKLENSRRKECLLTFAQNPKPQLIHHEESRFYLVVDTVTIDYLILISTLSITSRIVELIQRSSGVQR